VNSLSEYQKTALRDIRTKRLPNGEGYVARIPRFPGLIVYGETEHAARQELMSALEGWIELALRQGRGLPALKRERLAIVPTH
jgi:predicted RNase H-like HicB family nuclease